MSTHGPMPQNGNVYYHEYHMSIFCHCSNHTLNVETDAYHQTINHMDVRTYPWYKFPDSDQNSAPI